MDSCQRRRKKEGEEWRRMQQIWSKCGMEINILITLFLACNTVLTSPTVVSFMMAMMMMMKIPTRMDDLRRIDRSISPMPKLNKSIVSSTRFHCTRGVQDDCGPTGERFHWRCLIFDCVRTIDWISPITMPNWIIIEVCLVISVQSQ